MTNETNQPFAEQPPRHPDDSQLVEKVLGSKQADEMRELTGGQATPDQTSEDLGQLELTKDEQAATTEAEKTIDELRRDEYIIWAENISKDKDWVDRVFTFNPDGTVVANGGLDFKMLTSPLQMPPALIEVTGYLYLDGLTSGKDLVLPESIGGGLSLRGLTSGKDLVFPKIIRDIFLDGLTSAKYLVLPESIGGNLQLNNLISAEHLVLPTSIDSSLHLSRLTSAEHLVLPSSIGGNLNLRGLTSGFIPAGCDVTGAVHLNKNQTEIIADARKKGYVVLETEI